jgi:hypothetical protein
VFSPPFSFVLFDGYLFVCLSIFRQKAKKVTGRAGTYKLVLVSPFLTASLFCINAAELAHGAGTTYYGTPAHTHTQCEVETWFQEEKEGREELARRMGGFTADTVVCVTGGSGYLGSWLVRKLLGRGCVVHATLRSLGIHAPPNPVSGSYGHII